jgi:hypothetical protein
VTLCPTMSNTLRMRGLGKMTNYYLNLYLYFRNYPYFEGILCRMASINESFVIIFYIRETSTLIYIELVPIVSSYQYYIYTNSMYTNVGGSLIYGSSIFTYSMISMGYDIRFKGPFWKKKNVVLV